MNTDSDRLDILSISLLDSQQKVVEEMRQVSKKLGLGLGWHYLLDLSWAAEQLMPTPGMRVLDAGAGTGIMQWWLAAQGVNVISVDRDSRRHLPLHLRQQYRVMGLRREDLVPLYRTWLQALLPPHSPRLWRRHFGRVFTLLRQQPWKSKIAPDSGTVFVYNQGLSSMTDIPDSSVDAVVSISALEHNSPDRLPACVAELMRTLKPGGKLVATLAAAKERDWFHEPSQGWCYTEATLRSLFNLSPDCPSNYERYDALFEELRDCAELRDNLDPAYFKKGNNGMPWGTWDPQYQPVGVVKMKRYER